MKKLILIAVLALLPAALFAQTATLSWTASDNTVSATEAASLTYTLYVNGAATGVLVPGATCTGATAPFTCTAPVPSGVPTNIGTKLELTAKSGASQESPRSVPFISAPTAPTNLKRQ